MLAHLHLNVHELECETRRGGKYCRVHLTTAMCESTKNESTKNEGQGGQGEGDIQPSGLHTIAEITASSGPSHLPTTYLTHPPLILPISPIRPKLPLHPRNLQGISTPSSILRIITVRSTRTYHHPTPPLHSNTRIFIDGAPPQPSCQMLDIPSHRC